MEVHRDSALDSGEQKRLGDIRRFLSPRDQAQLERTLTQLEEDPNLPGGIGAAAVERALSGFKGSDGFCQRVKQELSSHRLSGPESAAPERLAYAVPIREAYDRWLSAAGKARYEDFAALARAIRDAEFALSDLAGRSPIALPGELLFVTEAAEFSRKGPSAARRMCLSGPASPSYVIAFLDASDLGTPLRVPTAVDGACRPLFELPEAGADHGRTCSGRLEFVTDSQPLSKVRKLKLSR